MPRPEPHSLSDGERAHIAVQRWHLFGPHLHTVECDECHDTFHADWMIVTWRRRLLCAWCVLAQPDKE